MSSGSGKKKLVAAAASPLSVSIAANPVASETPTGGIKLLIDKNRIVSVPSTKPQPTVVPRQPSVVNYQNVSLSQQTPANEDYFRIAGSNAGGGTTISFKGATGTQKILVKKITPITSGAEIHGISGGEMRVKVTGEDMNRNGQPMAGSVGPLKQIKVPATLLGRRMSIHRRLPVTTTQELDSGNGQQAVTLYTTTVRLSDEQSLLKHKISSNNAFKVPVSTAANIYSVPVTASGGVFVPVSSNALSLPASIVANVASNTNAQINQTQCIVSSKNKLENGKDVSTSVRHTPPNEAVQDRADSLAVVVTVNQTVQPAAASTAMGEDGQDQSKQPITAPATFVAKGLDEPTATTIIDTVVLDEETVSKPSREMKSLQVTQAKSKILSEFITDTFSKGKLRKRRSDSIVDAAAVVETTGADISPTRAPLVIPPRKRNRRRSTVLLVDAITDNNGKELASDVGHKMEDLVNDSPTTRVRKIRSTKSEYAVQKGDRNAESLSGGAKDFFSNLNLQHEISKASNDQLAFPGDPPKPGWDRFCWRCKKRDPNLGCSSCIRSYHKYCVRYTTEDPNWSCTDCKMAIHGTTDIESFSTCLGYLVNILLMQTNLNNSLNPINKSLMPHYDKYITRHIDLAVLNELQAQKAYKSSEEFLTDVGWIVHNMSIYPDNMNLLKHARALQKRAKQEVEEMEPCYECYIKANTLCEDWFREPCSKPHLLVWAKMKGYPYWPGKLYVINSNNQAFVRFFGAHDRSWMSVKECYLFSERDPNPPKQNLKSKLVLQYASSLEDIQHHIDRLREQFNTFNYGSFMEAVDPSRFEEQQRAMLPGAFLKKVKVTIKRSEGEMVAVASAASDEAAVQALPNPKTSVEVEEEKVATSISKAPAKKVVFSSPRKRMTRRMSRFMKTTDELTNSLMNTEGSQDLLAPFATSLLPNNDKTAEKQQTSSDVPTESREEGTDDVDCNPKNLSLLLRRGSQSWETEPLSKRRKSVAEKGTLVSAAPKTTKPPTATGSKVKETLPKETAEPVGEKAIVVPQNVLIEKAILESVAPTKTTQTGAGLRANETIRKEAVAPVTESNVTDDKTILVSVAAPPTSTKSTVTELKSKETARAAVAKDDVEPDVEKVTLVSLNAVDPTQAAVRKITNTADETDKSIKQATAESQPSHTLTTVANSSEDVSLPAVTATNTTKPCVNPLESVANWQPSTTNPTTVDRTTVAAPKSDTAANATDGTSTVKTIPTTIAVSAIKQEISSDDETNIVERPIVVLPVPTKEPVRNNNSASLTPPSPSVSANVIKRQNITSPISSATAVAKSVQQTLAEVLPISSTTITMVTSKQRARKSFPGGASNTKHVPSKQGASLVHNVSLPTAITVPSGSPHHAITTTTTNALQQSLGPNPMNATVSIPKELVAPATVVSLPPYADDCKTVVSSNDVTAASNISNVSNDNDDVLIIEEDAGPSSVTPPSGGRKIDGNNQLPPPLVPRPPETSISLPCDDDSMVELNRTMQLFDDSSNKVLDHIRTVMEDLLKDMSGNGSSLAELATLKLNQERQQELWLRDKEKQQNAFDGRLAELRVSLEQEKHRALNEQRQQLLREKQRAVQSTKMKQWCKKCFSEAHYYCCWNTSYCSAACQKKHWMEHQHDCTQEHANNARSVQSSSAVTNSFVFSDSNNSSTNSGTNSHMRNRACLQISAIPSYGCGVSDGNNLLSKRPTNSRAFPSEITSTSTPLQTPVRFVPSTVASSVSYKTPIIQSVHGRDGMIINLPSHSPQNGGNVTLGVSTASTPQQLMQKRAAAARDKSIQLNPPKADSRNKGYTSRKTYDLTSSPYQSTGNNLLASSTSAIVPSVASTYTTVTLADTVTVSGGSSGVWNQVAMLQSSGNRQLHSGSTAFASAVGVSAAAGDGTEKGYPSVEMGLRPTHPTVTSLGQQQKTVQQQTPTIAYMRHPQ